MTNCSNCRYYIQQRCKRLPPSNFNPFNGMSAHPIVDPNDTCGEFKKKEENA